MFRAILFLYFMVFPFMCQAHVIEGSSQQIGATELAIFKVERYFNHQFLPLHILIANSKQEYRELLHNTSKLSAKKISYLSHHSIACGIWNTNIIYFNSQGLSDSDFQLYMIHELIHKYQYFSDPDAIHTKRLFLEKQAISLSKQINH